MEFKKYGSIENSYREKFLNQVKKEGLGGGEWIVGEKIHGANFSFWCTETEYRCARRTDFIPDDEVKSFNKADVILDKHRDRLNMLLNHLKVKYNFEVMTVYGELAGGSYPHDEVPKNPQAVRVQKGVHYAPFNFFYGFDIALDEKLLNEDEKFAAFQQCGFMYDRPLFRGTLDECLSYPNMFVTHIPEWLGLPQIGDNVCEGVVIRPVEPAFLNGGGRVIFKNKNEKFEERKQVSDKSQSLKIPMEGEILDYYNKISSFITENRLRNVLSHMGPITSKDFGKIASAFNKDIMEDFLKDNKDFNKLEKNQTKRISKEITRITTTLIRDNFLNIIDGNF